MIRVEQTYLGAWLTFSDLSYIIISKMLPLLLHGLKSLDNQPAIQLLLYCDISEQLWFRICIVVSTIKYLWIYPSSKQKFMLISAINVKSHYDSGYRLHCVIYQPSGVELLRDFIFKLIKSNHLSPLHFLSSFPSSFQIFFLQDSLHIPSTHFEWKSPLHHCQ